MMKFKITNTMVEDLLTTEWERKNDTVEIIEVETKEDICIDWTSFLDDHDDIEESEEGMRCESKCEGKLYVWEVQEVEA